MSEVKDETVKEILKYKPVKNLLTIFLIVVISVLVITTLHHFYRCYFGFNSRLLWGLEECLECKVIDSTKHDTTWMTKTDTVRIISYVNTHNNKGASAKNDTTSKTASKFQLNSPTFNAPTQIGDNNKQDNSTYAGIKQRHPTEDAMRYIIDSLHKCSTDSIVFLLPYGDQEATNYANEIARTLLTNGFRKRFTGGTGMVSGVQPPAITNGVAIVDLKFRHAVQVYIFPAKNVQ